MDNETDMASLRKIIANSSRVNRWVEGFIAYWIEFSFRTSQWSRIGFEAMEDAMKAGEPVIVVLWHQRLIMAPYFFDLSLGPVCTLTSTSRAGRLAGNVVEQFGLGTIAMSSHKRNISLTRDVLRKIRAGVSVGLAADGPRGPAKEASLAPIVWAKAAKKRIFVVSYSQRRVMTLPTWDRMWMPLPWSRGCFKCSEWNEVVPRTMNQQETERLQEKLKCALDEVTDATDQAVGRIAKPSSSIGKACIRVDNAIGSD